MTPDIPPRDLRIVKVPLPVDLIRRMDEAVIDGRAGYRTRAELVEESISNHLDELQYPVSDVPAFATNHELATETSVTGTNDRVDRVNLGITDETESHGISGLEDTRITIPPAAPSFVKQGAARAVDEFLLGLHNRDYTSIWALAKLAEYTVDGPIDLGDFFRRVTEAAWSFGLQLEQFERESGLAKLALLFPTNVAKQPSAERGFQNFAIGTIGTRSSDGSTPVSGALFVWKAIQLSPGPAAQVGLTEQGWALLSSLHGLSLDLPHDPRLMNSFMKHLGYFAREDLRGFSTLLRAVSDGVSRDELVRTFAGINPNWSPATASSVVQGYIARAREWGLLEPKLIDGMYFLTETGRNHLPELAALPTKEASND